MKLLYKICKTGSYIYYSVFFKLKIEGLENVQKNQNYVICANHYSAQDPILLGGVMPLEARFMAKKELFKSKIVGGFISALGVFPVDRENNDLKAIKMALTILKNEGNLALFPEGTRNKSMSPVQAKSGVAMLAVKTKTPILPITIDTEFRFFKPVRVVFHAPLVLSDYYDQKNDSEVLDQISHDVMLKIYSVFEVRKGTLDKQ